MSLASPALAGVRVVDLTTVVFGPLSTQTLADYGADVIKIEPPDGESTRRTGPAREPGMASIFLGANRNKRSVVLDLKQAEAQAALLLLLDTADVFIHNVRPQKLAALGLDAPTLRARCPRLVYVGLHGFGDGGPYAGQPAYDDIIQSLSGAAELMGRADGTPRFMPSIVADKVCGHMAVHAVLAALFQRERSGRGQVVEVPMLEGMAAFLLTEHYYRRHLAADGEMGYPRALGPQRRPHRTADGHACVMPYTDAHWQRFFTAVGRPDLAADPRFAGIGARTTHGADLFAAMAAIVAQQPTAHWLALCAGLDIPCAPIRALADLEQDPHLQAVGMFQDVADNDGDGDGTGAPYRFVRQPVRLSDSQVPMQMPPRLGQHTRAVLDSLPLSAAQRAALLPDTDPTSPHPPEGDTA